jgi:hypothetical protein
MVETYRPRWNHRWYFLIILLCAIAFIVYLMASDGFDSFDWVCLILLVLLFSKELDKVGQRIQLSDTEFIISNWGLTWRCLYQDIQRLEIRRLPTRYEFVVYSLAIHIHTENGSATHSLLIRVFGRKTLREIQERLISAKPSLGVDCEILKGF